MNRSFQHPTSSRAALAERNAADYRAMNDIDDRRERLIKADSTGRHEPSALYGGLYHVEEVDDGGRYLVRRERGTRDAFVPVAELPAHLLTLIEPGDSEEVSAPLDIGKKQFERLPPEMQLNELRLRGAHRPAVIVRRRTTLRAV